MPRFRDLPIRRKITLVLVLVSVSALTIAALGFLALDVRQFSADLERDLSASAQLIADNTTAALSFADPSAARETLDTLTAKPNVEAAIVYDGQGRPFATYLRPGVEVAGARHPDPDGVERTLSTFAVTQPIRLQGRRVGTVHVRSDLSELYARLRGRAAVLTMVLFVSAIVATLVGAALQRLVSTPLVELADVARRITTRSDEVRRPEKLSDDEVGLLVQAFNEMLDRIEQREGALIAANRELAREVGERQRAEEERSRMLVREREANRLKDEFLATLSHELRTPLNAVLGWARILRMGGLTEPQQQEKALETIQRNAEAQAHLVDDLLDVSRIITGKLRLQTRPTDLVEVVGAALEVVRPAADAKGITLERAVPEGSVWVSGDAQRLQQLAWNLLSNAVKFTPRGGRVAVELAELESDAQLRVSDTGVGINKAFLPFVFDPFRQADGSSTREHGGLGLGLAIVRQIAELHGGTVTVDSGGQNAGAAFTVRLPRRHATAAPGAPALLAPSGGTAGADFGDPELRGIRVLVVDDDPDAREMIGALLVARGAHVATAPSTAEALALFPRFKPDVLLSDIAMQGEDGYALMRRLRASGGEGHAVPALALTAYAGPRAQQLALAAGFHMHLAKPFEPRELIAAVRALSDRPSTSVSA